MFKALVIACALMNPKICITFEDVRDKLETEEQCIERVYQMRDDISQQMPHLKPMTYKCVQLNKGKFT